MVAQAQPIHSHATQKPRSAVRAALETAGHVSVISGAPDVATHLGNAAVVVEKSIVTVANKTAAITTKWGWKKLAAFCLKVAAASPLIAKIAVGVVVVGIAVSIYQVVRSA